MLKFQQFQAANALKTNRDQYHLLLFDLSIYGHHPVYIRHLLNYWKQQTLAARLTIVVSPRFLTEHADVVALGQAINSATIQFLAITDSEEATLKPRSNGINRNIRNFQEWRLLCQYAQQLQVDHALVMYYDTYQYYLALRLNPPCLVSGIYFRPTFHYAHFSTQPLSRYQQLQATWEKWILDRVLQNPQLHTLFSLDPFVTQYLEPGANQNKVVHLPDPVQTYPVDQTHRQTLRAQLGIEPQRQLFLLFGALTARKGIDQLLDAIAMLPPTVCQQLAIVMVGEAGPGYQQKIETRMQALVQQKPIQIVRRYQFVAEEEVPKCFQSADVVLALYQRHVGMSGILIQAAAAQKPVLSSDYGLMGELVKRYQLGLTIDSSKPEAIAQGLTQCLTTPKEQLSNSAEMQCFVEQNLASQFAATIFGQTHVTTIRTKPN